MNERSAAEVLKAQKAITFEFPLSLELKVYLIFSDQPSKDEVGQLKRVFEFIDGAFYPVTVEQTPVNVKLKLSTKRKRRMRPLKPCLKHPDSPRNPKSNRCRECEIEHGKKMASIFRFKRLQKTNGGISN